MAVFLKIFIFTVVICQITRTDQHDVQVVDEYDYSDGNENNMCSAIQEYEDQVVLPVNVTVVETVKELCWKFLPFKCSKKVNVTKIFNRTFSVLKTRTIFSCCPGYEKLSKDTCKPLCAGGCIYGNCTKPGHCECEAGWEGLNCTKECDSIWFGHNCDMTCSCLNYATCNRFNGTCYCTPGFTGRFCEIACKGAVEGRCNQTLKCTCMNGGTCRSNDSDCDCPPGYHGTHCEYLCEEWTFGDACSGICTCDKTRTELCSPVNGKCQCVQGWRGDKCDKPCELGTWGRHCEHKCGCQRNATCHHILGVCLCPPGWHGTICEEKCPIGFFEKDCKMKCPKCIHEPGTCHHETGWCNCPPGKTGGFCHLECPFGKFGANCTEYCLCNHNSSCDSVTGECSCTPGWTGTYCSTPCQEGTYGVNCSLSCDCSICDNEDGSCAVDLPEGMVQVGSQTEESPFSPAYVNAILGFFILIFFGLLLTAIIWKLLKTPYGSNLYQNVRKRFQGRNCFKASELRKEDSSSSNVFQEEVPTINPIGQFTNPLYYATEGIVNSDCRPTPTAHSIYATNEPNHNLPITDHFEDVEFAIPECNLGTPPEKSEIRISFRNGTQRYSKNSSLIINDSNTERKSPEAPENKMVVDEHRYENLTEDVTATIPKE